MGKNKVKMIPMTERKAIDVQKARLTVFPDFIYVNVCVRCDAIVFDPIGHYKWHEEKEI